MQVKSNASTFSFWLIGKKAKQTVSDSHIYVLVNIRNTKKHGEYIEFFVVPSKQLSRGGYHEGNWPNIKRSKVLKLQNNWAAFGKP